MVITHKLERGLNNVLQKVLNCNHGWELQIIYISCALDTIICINACKKHKKTGSYLTPLFLPEDRRLRVPFGLTREGGRAPLRHDLVPGPDHELGWCWIENRRSKRYKSHQRANRHNAHQSVERQASAGIGCRGHRDTLPCISLFPTASDSLGLSVCFDRKQRGDTDSNHREPFIQTGPWWAELNEWRADFGHGRAAVTTSEGREGHSSWDTFRDAMWIFVLAEPLLII